MPSLQPLLGFNSSQTYTPLTRGRRYKAREDWTVVNQPFMINSNIPLLADGTPDRSYLAPDCFHFARKTHNGAAVALWNNMLQPVGQKDLQWTLGESVDCPSHKQPYAPLVPLSHFF
jgi:phospholipase B1, membrane-associated